MRHNTHSRVLGAGAKLHALCVGICTCVLVVPVALQMICLSVSNLCWVLCVRAGGATQRC